MPLVDLNGLGYFKGKENAMIADNYSATATYKQGDFCYYNGTLKKAKQDIDTAEAWTSAHWEDAVLGEELTSVKNALIQTNDELYEIREPGPNLGYVTPFTGTKSSVGLSCAYENEKQLKVWGTLTSWVSINVLRGNEQVYAGAPNFNTNLAAGKYTLKAETDKLEVYYGTTWSNKQLWTNGKTITIENAVCLFLRPKSATQNFGTSENPTIFNFELFAGEVPIVPTAIDVQARNSINGTNCDRVLAHADFDYDRKHNIFNGTTFTAGKKVRRIDGALVDNSSSEEYLATDYIEIDPTKEYLCLNIYVVLNGEDSEDLVTGGNRVWIHTNYAFYDADKHFVQCESTETATSKAIPANAKYVRLTINNAAIIPYAVLFYGNYSEQEYTRYVGYRKEIIEEDVFAATGMEKLNMVMFGDSITYGFGANNSRISYVDFVNDYLRSNILNCGLGGSRMSQGSPSEIGLGSFASLCENIVSTDADAWDALETYAAASHEDWLPQITRIKGVDWANVQAIGLLYGANDWHNNVPVGTEYNETTTNYDGACAYGLKKLLTKYPHLQVIIFTPFFRTASDTNSDEDNSAGLNMDDYGDSLKHVQTVFHCPVVDFGNELGINRYTIDSYSPDGTHPRKKLACLRIGKAFAEAVKRYVQPY